MPQDVADACLFVAALPARAYVPELVLLASGTFLAIKWRTDDGRYL